MAKTPNILYTETGVSVDRCVIITGTGNRIELGLQMLEMNVFEDLFTPTISATLVLEDTFNLIEALPIVGQEWMFLSVSKPGFAALDGEDIHFSLVLRIYKIERVSNESPFKQVYMMHLTEEDAITNETTRVTKAYRATRPETAIRDIFVNSLGYDDDLFKQAFDTDFEVSATALSFTIPNLKPFQAISYLSSIAMGPNQINDYLFFENNGGYRFASLSSLFKQDPVMTVKYRIKTLNGSDPYINSLSPIALENTVLFDYLKSLAQGEFGIQSDFLDLSKQQYFQVPLSYKRFLEKKDKLNKFGKVPLNDWDELPKDSEPQPMYRVFNVAPTRLPGNASSLDISRMQTRLMQFASITNQRIKLHMPGSALFKVGATLQLKYPSISSKGVDDSVDDLLDKYLDAKYIITSVRHIITQKDWHSYLEISKDTLPNELSKQFGKSFTLEGL